MKILKLLKSRKTKKLEPAAQPESEILAAIEALSKKIEDGQHTRDVEFVDLVSERFDILSDAIKAIKPKEKSIETETIEVENPDENRPLVEYGEGMSPVVIPPGRKKVIRREKRE